MVLTLEHLLYAEELGAVVSVDGTLLVSYRDGTDVGVKAVDSTEKTEAVYEGLDLKARTDKPINITNWKYAEITCKPLPEGCSLKFWYKRNKMGEF